MKLSVRPLEPSDRPAYLRGFARLSPESRYLRFGGPKPRLTAREVAYLVDVDHDRHEALVAQEPATGAVLAVARYVRLPDAPTVADVAVTVLDAHQGRGVGTALMAQLAACAARRGVRVLRADVLAVNVRALRMLRRAGFRRVGVDGPLLSYERAVHSSRTSAPVGSNATRRTCAQPAASARSASKTAPVWSR